LRTRPFQWSFAFRMPDDSGEYPTWEYIVSFLKSHGCTYEEVRDSKGRTLRIFRHPSTGQKYSDESYHTDKGRRLEILESVRNVFGISLDR